MAFEHLFNNKPVEKTINYGGQEATVYFRKLTAGERMQLRAGSKGSVEDGKATFNIDWGDIDRRNHQKLLFSCCEADGKPAFKNLQAIAALEEPLFNELMKLCNEVIGDEPGNE
jgi:hypothetical protein